MVSRVEARRPGDCFSPEGRGLGAESSATNLTAGPGGDGQQPRATETSEKCLEGSWGSWIGRKLENQDRGVWDSSGEWRWTEQEPPREVLGLSHAGGAGSNQPLSPRAPARRTQTPGWGQRRCWARWQPPHLSPWPSQHDSGRGRGREARRPLAHQFCPQWLLARAWHKGRSR